MNSSKNLQLGLILRIFRYVVIFASLAIFAGSFPAFFKGAVVFLITLGVLVFVHEWGHYQFARWAGMKVNRFGIGFPPWIYTIRRNNIDYSLGALPIGGMVDIAGLGSEEEMVGTAKGMEAPTYERVPSRPFGQKQFQDASLMWRFLTLFAGPLMNLLFALVVFVGIYSVVGKPEYVQSNNIETVLSGSAAQKAGLKAGDKIVSVDGKSAKNFFDVSRGIRGAQGAPVSIGIERGGKSQTLTVTPTWTQLHKLIGRGMERAPSIGVTFKNERGQVLYTKMSPLEAAKTGFSDAGDMISQILSLVGRAFTFKLTSDDKDNVGGPVMIAKTVGEVAKEGSWQDSLLFAAAISINLALMNLLPLPALDGGRILFLGYELVMRRPVNPRIEGVIHAMGMALLLAFMLFITARDIGKLRTQAAEDAAEALKSTPKPTVAAPAKPSPTP